MLDTAWLLMASVAVAPSNVLAVSQGRQWPTDGTSRALQTHLPLLFAPECNMSEMRWWCRVAPLHRSHSTQMCLQKRGTAKVCPPSHQASWADCLKMSRKRHLPV